jgi:hypothetical protein
VTILEQERPVPAAGTAQNAHAASHGVSQAPNWDGVSMHEKIVDIPTADGRMETFITHPEAGGPFAPLVIYMDVWGLREELCDIARKVAVVGYYVVLPDLISAAFSPIIIDGALVLPEISVGMIDASASQLSPQNRGRRLVSCGLRRQPSTAIPWTSTSISGRASPATVISALAGKLSPKISLRSWVKRSP